MKSSSSSESSSWITTVPWLMGPKPARPVSILKSMSSFFFSVCRRATIISSDDYEFRLECDTDFDCELSSDAVFSCWITALPTAATINLCILGSYLDELPPTLNGAISLNCTLPVSSLGVMLCTSLRCLCRGVFVSFRGA